MNQIFLKSILCFTLVGASFLGHSSVVDRGKVSSIAEAIQRGSEKVELMEEQRQANALFVENIKNGKTSITHAIVRNQETNQPECYVDFSSHQDVAPHFARSVTSNSHLTKTFKENNLPACSGDQMAEVAYVGDRAVLPGEQYALAPAAVVILAMFGGACIGMLGSHYHHHNFKKRSPSEHAVLGGVVTGILGPIITSSTGLANVKNFIISPMNATRLGVIGVVGVNIAGLAAISAAAGVAGSLICGEVTYLFDLEGDHKTEDFINEVP